MGIPVILVSFGYLARSFRAQEPLIRCLGERLLQGSTAGLVMGLIPFSMVYMGRTYSSFFREGYTDRRERKRHGSWG